MEVIWYGVARIQEVGIPLMPSIAPFHNREGCNMKGSLSICYGGPDLPEKEEGKWLSEIASMQAASARGVGLSAITAPCLRLLDQESKTRSLFSSCNKGSL